jgi:hypothetical protein
MFEQYSKSLGSTASLETSFGVTGSLRCAVIGHGARSEESGARSQNPEFRFQLLYFCSLTPDTLRFGAWDVGLSSVLLDRFV